MTANFSAFSQQAENVLKEELAERFSDFDVSSRIEDGQVLVVTGRWDGGRKELRMELEEPVVELPLPPWASIQCSPGFESDMWAAGAEPAPVQMFASEARVAAGEYLERLTGALNALPGSH